MKKVYSAALGLLITGTGVMAQSKSQLPLEYRYKPTMDRVATQSSERGSTIWCDDFSNAANWELGTLDGTTDSWVIGTTVPDGPFAIAGIASTTAANGFALFDSDLLCSGSQNAFVQMATPVDLQGVNNVVLQFEQYYRAFQGFCFVDVSNDGSTWTEYAVNENVAVNAATANPQLFELNISATAGNQGSVWVRFRYVGGCDYAWMVDDVCIAEQVPYDLVMVDGYLTHTGTGEEYGRIPASQLNPTMLVGGTFLNNGASELTDVNVVMEVRNTANEVVFTSSTTVASLASGATGSLEEDLTLPALATGVYTATFTATSAEDDQDANLANNVFLRAFAISEDRYSLDGIDNHPEGYEVLNSLGTNSFEGAEDGLQVMTYYEVIAPLDVYGIEIIPANGTVLGGFIVANILDTADVFAATPILNNPIAETETYDLVQSDLNNGAIRVLFNSSFTLQPGGYYANVILNSNAGAGTIRVLDDQTVPQPGGGSLIYIPNDNLYTNGVASAVRLITEPIQISVGENNALEGVSMFPNPTSGLVNIRTSENEVFNVDVMNVTGELVRTARINGTSTMDLSELAKGVYTVRIFNERGTLTERVTLQ